jgi:nicotinate-nucleotide pyrophosphorylase (carboxylating)
MDAETRELVARALAEDLGAGDVTSQAVVPAEASARARIVQKAPGVVFGMDVAAEVFSQAGAGELEPTVAERTWRDEVPVDVATIQGPAQALLAGERVALNLLAHLSGVATLTARYAAAVRGWNAVILDTRKTTPGLRALEKAAVAAGGGTNHRMGLYDAILIKENHIALGGGIAAAVRQASEAGGGRLVEVECRSREDVVTALEAGADRLLLDNMGTADMAISVELRNEAAGDRHVPLEASGSVNLENVAEIAETGVDFISVGALTHSAPALDMSMLLESD